MAQDVGAKRVDWRITGLRFLFGHVNVETHNQCFYDARERGPLTIDQFAAIRCIETFGIDKVRVN